MKITLLLAIVAVVVVDDAQSQECDIIKELYKAISKFIITIVPDKKLRVVYVGCAKAFVLGDASNCDPKKFKLPQAKICEEVIQHVDFQKRTKEHNILALKSSIENLIYSNGGDADEVCEKIPIEVDKMLKKVTELEKGGLRHTQALFDKICKNDPKACKELKDLPKEVEDYLTNDLAPSFKDFIKIIKNTMKSKSLPGVGAPTQGVELFFGGGDFGIKVSKCVNEIITFATKMGKSITGR